MKPIIRQYRSSDEQQVVALWREVLPDDAPHNDPASVIRMKLIMDDALFYVAVNEKSELVGTALGGYDGHRGWIYAVAVHLKHQRQGIGRALIASLESALVERGCLKINLQVRASNADVVAFYEQLGYEVEPRISLGKRLYS